MTKLLALILVSVLSVQLSAAEITVNATQGKKDISPYIYGRNNSLSDDPTRLTNEEDWQLYRDAGVRIFRESGGNNSTKYNWRRKLSSHPDWYNNVYDHDWDFVASSIHQNMPQANGLFGFQILGKVAEDKNYNFDCWNYNQCAWWEGVRNNWAGGGGPDAGEGDPNLYLTDWPADSTVAILDHWFGDGGLGLNENQFRYWNMDNEPGIWNGTHDDVMKSQIPVEAYILMYNSVAKKARAKFPDIKIAGPIFANEWQWYNWNNNKVVSGNTSYTLIEYFIKRISELQQSHGIRILDVLTLHFYPAETKPEHIVQLHRVWFDKSYRYPGANGVRRAGSGDWDSSIQEEYIFERCREWLDQYMGEDHGITFGVTEMGINSDDPDVSAVWYASTMGVFADEGCEIFTPWEWETGMWEVLHLFSRYNKKFRVKSTSTIDTLVSAYTSVNAVSDSMTIVLVNRDLAANQDVTVNIENFTIDNGQYSYLMLNDLPDQETFISHTQNALEHGSVTVSNNSFSLNLPSLSVTSVLLTASGTSVIDGNIPDNLHLSLDIYPNPFNPMTTIYYTLPQPMNVSLDLYNIQGRRVKSIQKNLWHLPGEHRVSLDGSELASGIYLVNMVAGGELYQRKITIIK